MIRSIVAGMIVLLAACGGSGDSQTPSPERTYAPGAAEAIERVAESDFGAAWEAAQPGEVYPCAIVPSAALEDAADEFAQVEGACVWEADPSDGAWIVSFRQMWECRDFSGAEIGFQPCTGQASYTWWHLVDDFAGIELAEHGGNFPPWARQ